MRPLALLCLFFLVQTAHALADEETAVVDTALTAAHSLLDAIVKTTYRRRR